MREHVTHAGGVEVEQVDSSSARCKAGKLRFIVEADERRRHEVVAN